MNYLTIRQNAQHQYQVVLTRAFHQHKKSMVEAQRMAQRAYDYEYEVSLLTEQGFTRSDAQAVVDLKPNFR
jgi:hypothetical protein